MFANHKQYKVSHHYLWSTDQPSLSIILLSLSSCTMAKKARGVSSLLLLSLSTCLMSLTRSSPLGILIRRRSDMSIPLLIPQWSGHQNCSSVSFKNLFAKKSTWWPQSSFLYSWGQAKFKENSYCYQWVNRWFWQWNEKHHQQWRWGGWEWYGWGGGWCLKALLQYSVLWDLNPGLHFMQTLFILNLSRAHIY